MDFIKNINFHSSRDIYVKLYLIISKTLLSNKKLWTKSKIVKTYFKLYILNIT